MLVRLRSIVKTKHKRTQEGHHKWQRWTWGTRTTCSAPLSVLGSRDDWICIGPDGLGDKKGELGLLLLGTPRCRCWRWHWSRRGPTPPRLDYEPFGSGVLHVWEVMLQGA